MRSLALKVRQYFRLCLIATWSCAIALQVSQALGHEETLKGRFEEKTPDHLL